MMNRTSAVCLALCALFAAAGCELPQEGGGSDTPTSDTDSSAGATYTVLRIVDGTGEASGKTPGADIDALVAFRGEAFLFAGCESVSLVGEDNVTHRGNPFIDVALATLESAEQDPNRGFVSLAGGSIICQLSVPVQSGDTIEIWEITDDGDDPFKVEFATAIGEPFVASAQGTVAGTSAVTAP